MGLHKWDCSSAIADELAASAVLCLDGIVCGSMDSAVRLSFLLLIAGIVIALGLVCGDQLLGTKFTDRLIAAVSGQHADKESDRTPKQLDSETIAHSVSPASGTNSGAGRENAIAQPKLSPTASAQQKEKSVKEKAELTKAKDLAGTANKFLQHKEYPQAIVEATRAIETNEQCGYAYHVRASAYRELGLLKSAVADYKRASWLEPEKLSWDLDGISDVCRETKEPDKAIEIHSEFIARYPKIQWGYNARAIVYRDIGKYDEALKDAERALAIDPTRFEAATIRMEILEKRGQLADAANEATIIINKYPKIKWMYERRAELYQRLGEKEKAEQDLLTASKM